MEYEQTILTRQFLECMGKLKPEWIRQHSPTEAQKASFDLAINSCDASLSHKILMKWVEALEEGGKDIPDLWRLFYPIDVM